MKFVLSLLLLLVTFSTAWADDLYKVTVESQSDADLLRSTGIEPIAKLHQGYLVLVDDEGAEILQSSGLKHEFVATGVRIENLAVDERHDRKNVDKYNLLFEEDSFRLYQFSGPSPTSGKDGLFPLRQVSIPVLYTPLTRLVEQLPSGAIGLDSLISLVNQDTIQAYLEHLQSYDTRLAGTASNEASALWMAQKFQSFGYDSVVVDTFFGQQLWDYHWVQCQNVFATKVGTRYTDRHIIVGAHFDAVPDSPGADDNGSGTVAMLEMARALSNIETDVTFIFIAFDSEESGLYGAYHYADRALARGDDIVLMHNHDMIGHYTNDSEAVAGQSEIAYGELWCALADSLVGITGHISGAGGGTDSYAFEVNGYAITSIHEWDWSTVYHQPNDSTTYINFDYMSRIVKASLAHVYTVNRALPPVDITFIRDGGDGQSLEINWATFDPGIVDHYTLYYSTAQPESVVVAGTESSAVVEGLTEDVEYVFYVIAFGTSGDNSLTYHEAAGTPYHIPALPDDITAYPLPNGIRLGWKADRVELDFDHFTVIRDGAPLPDLIYDSFFVDSDPLLGTEMHEYHVISVDIDGYSSDLSGVPPVEMKVASLEPGRLLAVNRSSGQNIAVVSDSITDVYLREALDVYSCHHFGDSLTLARPVNLIDMIDYELIILGAESGDRDDIGGDPEQGGILDALSHYLSIGGKAIVFGRWGGYTPDPSPELVTECYLTSPFDQAYHDYFNVECRTLPLSVIDLVDTTLQSDLVGAHSLDPGYPNLEWDSITTSVHTNYIFTGVSGIPCPSLPIFAGDDVDTIYTYDSSIDSVLTEGRPIAWRSRASGDEYVFFEVPLSFMQRTSAVTALRQAVSDLGIEVDYDADDDGVLDDNDNCPLVANTGQEDFDDDGFGDACDDDDDGDTILDVDDNCSLAVNPVQEDFDDDGVGDACDDDDDGDTVLDVDDNCPLAANPDQEDTNDDGIGDACCCGIYTAGLTGNANCDEEGDITLSDITQLIDRVYISKQGLCCDANGNVNGSPDGLMTLSDITRLIDRVYLSKDPTGSCP